MTFETLGLSDRVLDAVKAAGYSQPTPIQSGAIPAALKRKDVLGLAQTGSGKTAAFTLPMLTLLETGRARARMPRTLVLEPTRELAVQVHEAFETFGRNQRLTVALLIGGVSFDEQNVKIDRGADVVIATPGRLLDHLERGKLLLHGIEILVIDEADRMLDMGFIPDIERICKILPITRQTLFFSATMPPEIQRITSQFLHAPERVEVARPATTAESIEQRLVRAPSDPKAKRETLRQLMRAQGDVRNAIVFANRKTTVGVLEASLKRHGFNAGALHGDMDQRMRLKTLEAFRAGAITYLIASDVAARGLDIPEVSHVFNFDVPVHADDYVHRVGRTGRAGRLGHSFTLVTPAEIKAARAIEQLIQREIPWHGDAPSAEEGEADVPRTRRGRSGEGRKRQPAKRGKETAPKRQQTPGDSRNSEQRPAPVAAKPQEPQGEKRRGSQPQQRERQPREPELSGFHAGNLPAFLARPVRV
ncbi:MAG: DEAD/DEAH box helicase [Parvibaculaceae bacterium]